jgi:hypothetical protein
MKITIPTDTIKPLITGSDYQRSLAFVRFIVAESAELSRPIWEKATPELKAEILKQSQDNTIQMLRETPPPIPGFDASVLDFFIE